MGTPFTQLRCLRNAKDVYTPAEAARAALGGGGGFLLGFAGRALRAGRQLMEYAAGDVRAERGSQKEGGEVVGEVREWQVLG